MSPGDARAPAAEVGHAVGALLDDFYGALDARDLERIGSLSARDADVVHVGTELGEHWIGWEALEAATRRQLESLRSFRVRHRSRVVKALGSGEVACFSQIMDLDIRSAGRETRLEHARLTGVAEKRDGRWVLVQTHLSMPDGPDAPAPATTAAEPNERPEP